MRLTNTLTGSVEEFHPVDDGKVGLVVTAVDGVRCQYPAWSPDASTIAYVAALIQHRFRMLGILSDDGTPVEDLGALNLDFGEGGDNVVPLKLEAKVANVGAMAVKGGKACPDCGSYGTVIRKDGCDFCTACGHIGSCG